MFVEESSTILKKALEKYADNMMYDELGIRSSFPSILTPCIFLLLAPPSLHRPNYLLMHGQR
jgi:hypothetical protein